MARAQARQEQGQALLSDVLLAKVQLAQAQEDLIRARNSEAMARRRSMSPWARRRCFHQVEGALAESTFEAGALDDRQSRALATRPDYQQALIGKAKASNGLNQARAEFLPTLNTFAGWEVDNETFAARGGNNWIAGATLNFNLFDGGARRAQRGGSARAGTPGGGAGGTNGLGDSTAGARGFSESRCGTPASGSFPPVGRPSRREPENPTGPLRNQPGTITDVLGAETAHTERSETI